MTNRLEGNLLRRLAVGLVLVGALSLLGAGAAGADDGYDDGYGSDGCAECPTPPPTSEPHYPTPPPTSTPPHDTTPPHGTTPPRHDDPPPHYGRTYPLPPPPSTPPGTPDEPPVLPRTGSSTAPLAAAGVGAVALGAGLVVVARRRKVGLSS